ncbi:hypothetical protein BCR43DRAFT_183501 [Syncephalastrum racemosum]|uniref:Protein kinase domain-containing protein n=1 Tax=Syncephalastrum racemosum TaxID=13706 RepID=A0A1X2HQH4_SYNRA|nr:hypothetical protein BCR43DRAFT_183501 [Syncephalastrum racemosum]
MHQKYTRVDEPVVFFYAYQPIYINGHRIFQKRPVALYWGVVISFFNLDYSFVYIPERNSYFHGSKRDASTFQRFDLEKYRLMRLPDFLGSGAESNTYLTVRPDRPSLQLVCKVKDTGFLRSRRKEMEILRKVRHPNVVRLIHYEEKQNKEYFITPL